MGLVDGLPVIRGMAGVVVRFRHRRTLDTRFGGLTPVG